MISILKYISQRKSETQKHIPLKNTQKKIKIKIKTVTTQRLKNKIENFHEEEEAYSKQE